MNAELTQRTTVLVAHPDAGVRGTARAALGSRDYRIVECGRPERLLATVRLEAPQVVLLAAESARRKGGSMLREIKTDPELFSTAVVVLAPGAALPEAVDWLDTGADDVLVEELTPAAVVTHVRGARRLRDLRLELLDRDATLEELAYTDDVTGLPNRRVARRQLEALLSRARRHGTELAVALIDVDRFKAVNDGFGHAVGDRVLRELSVRLEERVRQEDVVARHGGEEFLVLLPDTAAPGAAVVAEGLREHVAGRPFADDAQRVPLTVSVGWASWAGEVLDDLIQRADAALYAAKGAGRNRVCTVPAVNPSSGSVGPNAKASPS